MSAIEEVGLLFSWNDNIRGVLSSSHPQQAGLSDTDTQQVLTGRVPFHDVKTDAVMMRIVRGIRPERPRLSHSIGFTGPVWTIVEGCWKEYCPHRPDVLIVVRCLEAAAAQWTPTPPLNDDPRTVDESEPFSLITPYSSSEKIHVSGKHPRTLVTQ